MKNPLRLIDRRGLSILIGAFVVVTLVAVIVIVLTMMIRDRQEAAQETARILRERQALSSSTDFGMEDFYLDTRDPDVAMTYPARPRRRFWSDEDVDFYWIDPAEAGLGSLEEDNDRRVRKVLGIPTDGEDGAP